MVNEKELWDTYHRWINEITEKTGIHFDIDDVTISIWIESKIQNGDPVFDRYIQLKGKQNSSQYKKEEILPDFSDEKGQVRNNIGGIDYVKSLVEMRNLILEKTGIHFGVNDGIVGIEEKSVKVRG